MDGTVFSWTLTAQGWALVRGSAAGPRLRARSTLSPPLPHSTAAMDEADDRALVDACLAGDNDAFAVLVERHRREVYRLCLRFAGNHEDAGDLAQDVFLRAYRSLGTFRGQSTFRTWIYRIAVNQGLNQVSTKPPVLEPLEGRDHQDRDAERPDEAVLRAERARTVRAAIASLPPKQRAAAILRVYHELPHEQIAAILGSSVGAVKVNFFHALTRLRKLLREAPR